MEVALEYLLFTFNIYLPIEKQGDWLCSVTPFSKNLLNA